MPKFSQRKGMPIRDIAYVSQEIQEITDMIIAAYDRKENPWELEEQRNVLWRELGELQGGNRKKK